MPRVPPPWSLLLCATPRTGSTLLCDLLSSTGVAGRPHSFFRQEDRAYWSERLGLPVAQVDHHAFARAVRQEGSTRNGVFAARVMWATIEPLVDGLAPGARDESDLSVLQDAFGPLRLVHLRRCDVVGQAVSWARAEQTGLWQQGDPLRGQPHLDRDQIARMVRTVGEHEAAWADWFARQDAPPLDVTYEEVVADPSGAVHGILAHLGIEPPPGWQPASQHRRQADGLNASWRQAFLERSADS